MSEFRPLPTAEQSWFDQNGKPIQFEYLFALDQKVRDLSKKLDDALARIAVLEGP